MTPQGNPAESLIGLSPERTSQRTRHLLVAARLSFVFSHGALAISISAALGSQADFSWWAIFTPAWFGDTLSAAFCIYSWFASCPYIQLCIAERQARLGDNNPSILTDILPDIVWAILGLCFVLLALTAELMFCRYLDVVQVATRRHIGDRPSLVPCTTVFIIVSLLACCRGICIRTSGELFCFIGSAALVTSVLALLVPGGLAAPGGWVLLLPSAASVLGALVVTVQGFRRCSDVLAQEERVLRRAEQVVLAVVLLALTALILVLASGQHQGSPEGVTFSTPAALAGGTAGVGLCAVAALRARMALLGSRLTSVRERLISLHASPLDFPPCYPAGGLREAMAPLEPPCGDAPPTFSV